MVGLSIADVIVQMGGNDVALIDTEVGVVVLIALMRFEIKLRQIHSNRSGIDARTGAEEMPVAAMSCNACCIGKMEEPDVVDGILSVVGVLLTILTPPLKWKHPPIAAVLLLQRQL